MLANSCKKNTGTATCPGYTIYIPNSFTPNGNGLNNTFAPKSGGWIKDYQMWIYSEKGQQLYYTKSFYPGWNGTVQSDSGKICPEGQYLYRIITHDTCGNQHSYTGYLYLEK